MEAGSYEIRIKGHVGDNLLASFDGLDSEIEPAKTILRGDSLDQAALHGILERVRELGLELLEVRRICPPPAQSRN
jgi:hypothetical protein